MDQVQQKQLYKEHSYLFQHSTQLIESQIVDVIDAKTKAQKQILRISTKENIFHPQGGGQPNDIGYIKVGDNKYQVDNFNYDRLKEIVYLEFHQNLTEIQALIQQDTFIDLIVDETERRLNARLHSAGHLVDVAVKQLELGWKPAKGYHFKDSPYVEYNGNPENINYVDTAKKIQESCARLIQETKEDDLRKVFEVSPLELEAMMGEPQPHAKDYSSIRIVKLCDADSGCPCGGTHVFHIKEIGGVIIPKVQKKGKQIRVSYNLA